MIGGPGSFSVAIKERAKFKEAIRTKLILEVADAQPQRPWSGPDALTSRSVHDRGAALARTLGPLAAGGHCFTSLRCARLGRARGLICPLSIRAARSGPCSRRGGRLFDVCPRVRCMANSGVTNSSAAIRPVAKAFTANSLPYVAISPGPTQGRADQRPTAACCGRDNAAISATSFLMIASPNELKFCATITKAPGPPMTLSR